MTTMSVRPWYRRRAHWARVWRDHGRQRSAAVAIIVRGATWARCIAASSHRSTALLAAAGPRHITGARPGASRPHAARPQKARPHMARRHVNRRPHGTRRTVNRAAHGEAADEPSAHGAAADEPSANEPSANELAGTGAGPRGGGAHAQGGRPGHWPAPLKQQGLVRFGAVAFATAPFAVVARQFRRGQRPRQRLHSCRQRAVLSCPA